MKCDGFDPVADTDSRLLILGTLPSEESLKVERYYANKTNQFKIRPIRDGVTCLPRARSQKERRVTALHVPPAGRIPLTCR